MTITYSVYCQETGKKEQDVTGEAFPQGYPLERETAFLLWWATQDPNLFVPGFELYHRAPRKIHLPYEDGRGVLIGEKHVDSGVFRVFKS